MAKNVWAVPIFSTVVLSNRNLQEKSSSKYYKGYFQHRDAQMSGHGRQIALTSALGIIIALSIGVGVYYGNLSTSSTSCSSQTDISFQFGTPFPSCNVEEHTLPAHTMMWNTYKLDSSLTDIWVETEQSIPQSAAGSTFEIGIYINGVLADHETYTLPGSGTGAFPLPVNENLSASMVVSLAFVCGAQITVSTAPIGGTAPPTNTLQGVTSLPNQIPDSSLQQLPYSVNIWAYSGSAVRL